MKKTVLPSITLNVKYMSLQMAGHVPKIRRGARNEEKLIHGKHKILEDSIISAKSVLDKSVR